MSLRTLPIKSTDRCPALPLVFVVTDHGMSVTHHSFRTRILISIPLICVSHPPTPPPHPFSRPPTPLPLPLPPPLASRLPPLYLRRPPAPPIPLHPAGSGTARAVCRRIWGQRAWGSEPPSDLGSTGLGRRRLALGREGDGEQAAMPLAERGKGSRPPGPWPRG